MSGFASAGGFAMPCAPAKPKGCAECGTPLDDVPFVECATHRADAEPDPAHPPQLTMDERPFAPVDPAQGGPDLGFVERANVPVGAMRRSIHKSHRAEGRNFVD